MSADPADINVLDGYSGDPRIVDNLVDGVCHTCDDLHVWLCPFEEGRVNSVCIVFDEATRLSVLRIWNYNKSRIHSYRGARFVEVKTFITRV